MDSRICPNRDRSAVPRRPASAGTWPYLRVPDRLLRDFAHDPLAVGVYLAVARCALSLRGAAPLSPADLAAWSSGSRTRDLALMRRIRRLTEAGWLIAEHGRAVKLRLLPSWGLAPDGAALPWQLDDAHSGRPEGLRVRRVPLDLLDSYIGRLDPQPGRRPAVITRYFDRPLLGLADLGAYVIGLITTVEPSERLRALGLFDATGPQPPRLLADLLEATRRGEDNRDKQTFSNDPPGVGRPFQRRGQHGSTRFRVYSAGRACSPPLPVRHGALASRL